MSAKRAIILAEKRKDWRRNPILNFLARPTKNKDGTLNLMIWECGVPGKKGTIWENGFYKFRMTFTPEYPKSPPNVNFVPPLYHPNVFRSGRACESFLLNGWHPELSIGGILLNIQELLDVPNIHSLAPCYAYYQYKCQREEYDKRVRNQAGKMRRAD